MKKFLIAIFFTLTLVYSASADEIVHAYTTLGHSLAKALFDEFEADTGIKVLWERLSGGEAISRLEEERENPRAEIWVGGVGTQHLEAKNRGLTVPYKSDLIKNIPMHYRDKDFYWTGLYIGPLSFCINLDLARKHNLSIPRKWIDLIKPELVNRIRVAHPETSGTAYNMITTIIRICNGDEDFAFEYFKELKKSIDIFTRSGVAPAFACATGEVAVGIGYLHDQIKLQREGAHIDIIIPEDGTGFETASMSILKNNVDQTNAKKLYDWILGRKATDIISRWYVIPLSRLATATSTGFSLSNMNLVNQDDKWDADNKERLIERWNKEIAPAPEN